MVSVSRDFEEASVLVVLPAVVVRESIRKPREHSMYTKGRRSGRARGAREQAVKEKGKSVSGGRRQQSMPLDNSPYNVYYGPALKEGSMINIRKSSERGKADHGWLDTRFTF